MSSALALTVWCCGPRGGRPSPAGHSRLLRHLLSRSKRPRIDFSRRRQTWQGAVELGGTTSVSSALPLTVWCCGPRGGRPSPAGHSRLLRHLLSRSKRPRIDFSRRRQTWQGAVELGGTTSVSSALPLTVWCCGPRGGRPSPAGHSILLRDLRQASGKVARSRLKAPTRYALLTFAARFRFG